MALDIHTLLAFSDEMSTSYWHDGAWELVVTPREAPARERRAKV